MCHGQIIDHSIRKARKVHHCTGCGRDILPGRKYLRQVQKDGDSFDRFKECLTCVAIARVYQEEIRDGECYIRGEPRDHFRELLRMGDETIKGLLAKLRAARQRALTR